MGNLFHSCGSAYLMEFRVEGRRPRTWLESVEADMAELEIDTEDVNVIKKWML